MMRKPASNIKPRHKRISEDTATRRARQAIEGVQAMAEYLNAQVTLRERTARLRELRLTAHNSSPKQTQATLESRPLVVRSERD
jgi:hypothetical protein